MSSGRVCLALEVDKEGAVLVEIYRDTDNTATVDGGGERVMHAKAIIMSPSELQRILLPDKSLHNRVVVSARIGFARGASGSGTSREHDISRACEVIPAPDSPLAEDKDSKHYFSTTIKSLSHIRSPAKCYCCRVVVHA